MTTAPSGRLLTAPFVALWVSALAFFGSGGVVLPVASRFAAGPLGADGVGIGVSIGAFSIAALVLRPVVGWASDRFGRRPLLIGGGLMTAIALVLHLGVNSLPLFIAVRSLLGIGEAFYFVAALAAIADLAPAARRGEAINIGSLSVYLGLAIGPFIGESVLTATGYTAVWLLAAAMAGLATLVALAVPETSPGVLNRGDGPVARSRLIHPAGIFPGLLILTGAWGMAGFLAFVPLHADQVGLGGAAGPLALYALIVVGLRIVFVKLPDQVGPTRLSSAALAVSAVGLALVGLLGGPIGLIVGTIVFAVGIAFMFPALIAVAVGRVDETERGSVVGTASAFLDLSFGVAPAVIGSVAEVTGFGPTFLLSAVIAATGSVALIARRGSIARPVVA